MSFDKLHIFDINRETFDRWQTLPDPIRGYPDGRAFASAVNVGNKWLFVIGGSVRPVDDSSFVWRLDIASSRWQTMSTVSAGYCQLSGLLLVLMKERGHYQVEMFRVVVPSLAWMSYSKVLSLLKPETLAAVHVRLCRSGPSVNVAEATS